MSAPADEMHGTRRVALTLALAVLLAVVLLGGVRLLTAERATEARAALLAERLEAVLHGVTFERVMPAVSVPSGEARRADEAPLSVQRARHEGRTVAAVLHTVAPDGYSGAIDLLVGVRADGSITGVRVLSHRETPGLGDRIERRRSDWISGFDGHSLERTEWRLGRAGGEDTFDALSGATITSRAVVDAVHRALVGFAAHRDEVLAP